MKLEDFRKKVKNEIALGNTREAIILLIDNLIGLDEPLLFSSSYYIVRRDYDINVISEDIFYRSCNKINDGILNFLKNIQQHHIVILGKESESSKAEETKFSWKKFFPFGSYNRRKKLAIYVKAFLSMIDLHSDINEFHSFVNPSPEKTINLWILICTKLKNIYDSITNSSTSVSIKIIIRGKSSLDSKIITLVRDNKTNYEGKTNYSTITHKITNNTNFFTILEAFLNGKTEDIYYFSNNIATEKNYSSSYSQYYTTKDEKTWALPYKSEIVVPITPLKKAQNRDVIMMGFLCLECESTDNFNETLDVKILQSIADFLYYQLIEWLKKREGSTGVIDEDATIKS